VQLYYIISKIVALHASRLRLLQWSYRFQPYAMHRRTTGRRMELRKCRNGLRKEFAAVDFLLEYLD
jgi:hypothetical protein